MERLCTLMQPDNKIIPEFVFDLEIYILTASKSLRMRMCIKKVS